MLTLEQFRMRKKTGPFDDKVKTDAQKMAKQPKYKGSTSKLEADIRKKHGDKNANHFVIQNIIRKHAETNESVGKTPGDEVTIIYKRQKNLLRKLVMTMINFHSMIVDIMIIKIILTIKLKTKL